MLSGNDQQVCKTIFQMLIAQTDSVTGMPVWCGVFLSLSTVNYSY